MSDDNSLQTYNEANERQRLANALTKHNIPVNDKVGRLAWNIAVQYGANYPQQDELFAELVNLIARVRDTNVRYSEIR